MPDKIEIEACPIQGCGAVLHYGANAICVAGHRFAHYKACGGLQPLDDGGRYSGPMFVSTDEVGRMLDLIARTHNALVWYSGDSRRFWGRLLDVMGSFREPGRVTQMDFEYDRLRDVLNGVPAIGPTPRQRAGWGGAGMTAQCPVQVARLSGAGPHGVFQCGLQVHHAGHHDYDPSPKPAPNLGVWR